jgi:UDP-N-acetylglucosamine/UDP-N-acetylgalactosamine diphosphorylase
MELGTLLESFGQAHLLAALERLDPPARERLEIQIAAVPWEEVSQAHSSAGPRGVAAGGPVPECVPASAERPSPRQQEELRRQGLGLLAQGKAAFVLMAGGQGSRLGFSGPKGAAPLGWPNGWTLFDLLVRRIARLGAVAGKPLPFLVMTSPENDGATRTWFQGQDLLPSGSVRFFQQGVLPALDETGRALLAAPDALALAPDGNGGIFQALARSGRLEELASAGVEWLHIAGVDNALSLPCDPVFLGFAEQSGHAVASKSVLRDDPAEKAGVFRLDRNGNGGVAEYTELGELAGRRAEDGGLLFREANIASHLVRLDAVRHFAAQGLPWHLARKKLAHLDPETGRPATEPVCKYERFLFDAFPLAGKMAILQVARADEFAPVKNAEGADSPASALAALRQQAKKWQSAWRALSQDDPRRKGEVVDPMDSLWGEAPAA